MLGIKTEDGRWITWHLTEPIPPAAIRQRVVEFQADGDELNLFLTAMTMTRKPVQGVSYTKTYGLVRDGEDRCY